MKKRFFLLLTAVMSVLSTMASFASEAGSGSGATADGAGQQTGGWWIWIVIYGGMFAVFYFLLIRPNKKKQKAEEELRNNITLGDEIVSIGGICGRVVSIKDDEITIESSIDRTLIQFKKWAVREVKKLETEEA